ncbi:MAG: aminotransferase class I/II-fold pyridoxal phosphate-dependent enzyme [Candidatus Buchananbacteria bacterium]|nr:aminotransferase class I/II-fold pyridoxal phosphate-dependent enzyme [Candidatus Buchananbacteria bacterium]
MKLSNRAQNTPASPIRKFAHLETEAVKKGIKVFHFNIGQPDMQTPQRIRKIFRRFKGKIVLYAPSRGIPETITAWQKYYLSHGISLTAEDIIVTMGGSEAILFALMAVCDPADEVVVFEPFYTNYTGFAAMTNTKLVPLTTTSENNWQLGDLDFIQSKITDKTKAILICNPNNPTGAVYNKDELQKLVNLAYKNNLYLISDEVYREFIFNGEEHYSVLDFPEIRDRAIVIDSVSKRFNHCGGRVGCLVSRNQELINSVLKFAQARLAVPTLEQLSVIPLLNAPKEYTDSAKQEYKKRRDIIYDILKTIPGVECTLPKGSFYIIAKLPITDAEDFVAWMLTDFSYNNQTVMVTPAESFYLTPGLGKNEIRIAYVLNEKDTRQAMDVFKKGLEKYLQLKLN